MDIKKIIIENAYEFEKDRFIIGLGNIDQIITEIKQALQLLQTCVSTCFYYALQILTFIFVILFVLYKYYYLYL